MKLLACGQFKNNLKKYYLLLLLLILRILPKEIKFERNINLKKMNIKITYSVHKC